ncbi:hypothetical protein N9N67_07685 [Bacteriovoracaceae bacterium]|nr:hypothetical protein [Bacteriovoracaceae bacterium]
MRHKYFIRNLLFNFIIFLQLIFIPIPNSHVFAATSVENLPLELEDFRQSYFEKDDYGDVFGFSLTESTGKLTTPSQCSSAKLEKLDYDVTADINPQDISKLPDYLYFSNMIIGMIMVSMGMGVPFKCKTFFKSPMLTMIVSSALTYLINHFNETKNQVRANALAQERLMPLESTGGVNEAELRSISNQMHLIKSVHIELKILNSRRWAASALATQMGIALVAAIFGNGTWITSESNIPYAAQTAEGILQAIDGQCSDNNQNSKKTQTMAGKFLVSMYESIPSCMDKFAKEGTENFLMKFAGCSNLLKDLLTSLTGSSAVSGKGGGVFGDVIDGVTGAMDVYNSSKDKTSYHGYNRLVQKFTMKTFLTSNNADAKSGATSQGAETKKYLKALILLGTAMTVFGANATQAHLDYDKAKKKFDAHKCEFEKLWATVSNSNEDCPDCPPGGLALIGNGSYDPESMKSKLAIYRRQLQEIDNQIAMNDLNLCMDQNYSLSSKCDDPGEFQMMNKNHLAYPALGNFYNDSMGYANALNSNNFGAAQKFASKLSSHNSAINARIGAGKKKINDYMRRKGKKDYDIDKEIAKHVEKMRGDLMKTPGMQALKNTLDNKAKIMAKAKKARADRLKKKKSKHGITKHTAGGGSKADNGEGMFDDFDMSDYDDENNTQGQEAKSNGDGNSLNDFEISNNTIHDRPDTSIFDIVHTRYLLNYDKVLKKKEPITKPDEAVDTVKKPK